MRTIGVAEQALAAIIHRSHRRTAFGQILARKDTIRRAARMPMRRLRVLRPPPPPPPPASTTASTAVGDVERGPRGPHRSSRAAGGGAPQRPARLLCYLAAVQAGWARRVERAGGRENGNGFKAAKTYIAMTKVDAPRMCLKAVAPRGRARAACPC
eukprot:gene5813-7169_t